MPIIIINSLAPNNPSIIKQMNLEVRELGAKALRTPKNNVWVIFQPLMPDFYLYGEEPTTSSGKIIHPVIVIIKAQSGRTQNIRDAFIKIITESIARSFSIPTHNVWVHYQEMKPQDVWFEGHWASTPEVH